MSSVVLLMAASRTALGIPAPGTSVAVNALALRGESEMTVANPPDCESYRRLLQSIGTSKATLAFVTLSNVLARTICHLAHGSDCGDWAFLVQISMTIIYAAAGGASGAVPEGVRSVKRGTNIHAAYLASMEDSLAILAKRDGEPSLLSRLHVAGATLPDLGRKADIIANPFEDGTTVLQLPMTRISDNTNLAKRFGGAGFKVSYTTRIKTKLTVEHQWGMGKAIAKGWANVSNYWENGATDVIGFASVNHQANFYFRIIPELQSFGLNYESVDICGGKSGQL